MSSSQWCFDRFRLDPDNARLWRDAEVVPLPSKAFDVLHYLVTHPDRLVTKDELLDVAWSATAVTDAVVRVAIATLRKVLGDTAHTPRFIATVSRRGYRFLAPVTPVHAIEPSAPPLPLQLASPPLLIEREAVLHQLQAHLARARQGIRQVVFITGEPGMGKTTVVEAFTAQAAAQAPLWVAYGQCVEHYGPGEAYLPILEALGQLCRIPEGVRLVTLLRQQAPTWLGQMPWVLSAADRERLQHEMHWATRERMLREFAEVMDALTAETLLLLILEDLHWSDYATLDLLALLARRRTPARLFVLGTYRPVEVIVHGHPLRTVTQDLQRYGQGTELALAVLSTAAVAAYLAACYPGHRFPETLIRWLHRHTEGNPLFLVTLVTALAARGLLAEREGHWILAGDLETVALEVPEGLRPLLEQQFEHLPMQEQQVAEVASAAGGTFSAAVVAAGLEARVAHTEEHCDALVRRQVLRPVGLETWPDGTVAARYAFVHALYQQAAYERLGVGQRAHVHQRLGVRLELAYGLRVEEVAVELAVHFERSHDVPRAVRYWQQAAVNAVRRSAHQEVIGAVQRALALLPLLPDTPERTRQELALQVALSPALATARSFGASEAERAYSRARELAMQVGDTAQLCAVLWGLWRLYQARAELQMAQQLGEQLLSLAHRQHDATLFLGAYCALGGALLFRGEYVSAHTHASQGMALYDPQQHHVLTFPYGEDPGAGCHAYRAIALWLLGYPDQALTAMHATCTLARDLAHPFSLGRALHWLTFLHLVRREAAAAQEQAEAVIALAIAQGFPQWEALGTCWRGWALTMQGHREEGTTQIRQGMAVMEATGALGKPVFLALLAEAHGDEGQIDEGLLLLTDALATVDNTGERWWEAELYRLQGELLLRQGVPNIPQAEACLHQALVVARRQQARSWELRAATSLTRLWQQQGKAADARQLLAEVYGWFTEGFGTTDMHTARILLDRLG
jgi:DNA-binding winged helix-turn-helix (wHTH) protein/predicted ATPase